MDEQDLTSPEQSAAQSVAKPTAIDSSPSSPPVPAVESVPTEVVEAASSPAVLAAGPPASTAAAVSLPASGPEKMSSPDLTDAELFEQYLEQSSDLYMPVRGDLCSGVIVEIRSNEILVNIGYKRDGVVPQADLSKLDDDFVAKLKEGATVDVLIRRFSDDEEGVLQLSISEAFQRRDWVTAEEQLESGEITIREVIGYNKGGLMVEYGHLRGFIPASHLVNLPRNLSEEQRQEELERRIGEKLPVKVIEVARRRRRLVVSHMLAEREYRELRKTELFANLHVGDVVDGVVRSMRPFGAFVDIGGADGLLHVSEISWSTVRHPKEELQVGDKLQVEILNLDPENSRIALSRKRLLTNPWDDVEQSYAPGMIIPIKITRVVDFGAFAELESGVEGLIHISELADITIAEPLKTVQAGDLVAVKVLRVDARRQRIGLSRRQALGTVEEAAIMGANAPQNDAEEDTDTESGPSAELDSEVSFES